MRVAKHVGSFTVSVAALALTLVVLEIPAMVGWIDYRFSVGAGERRTDGDVDGYPPHTEVRQQTHGDLVPYYGIENAPTYRIEFRTDHNGFRNPSDLERAPVVVLGDSFVENSLIPDEKSMTTLLGRRLGVPVANLGHNGFGPHRQLGVLRRVGLGLRPRVVLWFFYEGNDLADTLTYGGETDWAGRSFWRNAEIRLAALVERVRFGETRRNYSWGAGDPFGSCRVRCRTPPCERIYLGNLVGPISLFEEVALRRVFGLLSRARDETRAHGASLVLVYAPVTLRVYGERCDFDHEGAPRRLRPNDLPQRMRRWADAHGVGFVDTTDALRLAVARGEQVYFPDDTHWNAVGNAVVAATIAGAPSVTGALGAEPGADADAAGAGGGRGA